MKINLLLHNVILNFSKLEAFADKKINVTQKLIFLFGRLENMVGKRENVDYQHFLLFPQCFQKLPISGPLKFSDWFIVVDYFFFSTLLGITRLERWKRADKHGLNPSVEVKELILEHSDDERYTQWYY